jgi:hypothetical protein
MVVVPWRLQANDDSERGPVEHADVSDGTTHTFDAPPETVACVIVVESSVLFAYGREPKPQSGGMPLHAGEHQFPITGGASFTVGVRAGAPPARVTVLWLRPGPYGAAAS